MEKHIAGYLFNGRFYKSLDDLKGKTMSEDNQPQPLYFHPGITSEDVEDLGKTAYETVLKTLYIIETTEARFLSQAIAHAKEQVYKACPELLPKDPRDA